MQNILGAAGRQDRLYGQFDSRFVAPGMGQAVDRREFDRPNDRFFGECDFHPVGIVFPRRRKLHRSVGFSFYEFFPVACSVAPDVLRFQRFPGVVRRGRESDDRHIAVIPPLLFARLRDGQRYVAGPGRGVRPAPCQMAHRLFRFDPRAARHRPAGTSLHRKAQSQPLALLCGIVPQRTEAGDLRFRAGPNAAELSVEQLYSRKAGRRDRFQVGGNSFRGYVAPDVMEPCFRIKNFRGGRESLFVAFAERLVQLVRRRYDRYLRRQGSKRKQ